MTLELTIQAMFDEQPMRFKERADCLNHLFCLVGNGYQWKNGELVEIDRQYTTKEIEQLNAHLIDGKAFQHNLMSWQDEIVETFISSMTKSFDGEEIPTAIQRAMDKHIAGLREKYPADVLHEFPRKERWDYSKLPYFAKYAKIVNIPDDIHDDWLAGIEECKQMLREDGFDV